MQSSVLNNLPLKRLIVALGFAGLASVGLAGCDMANGKTADQAPPAPPTVPVAIVTATDIVETQEFSGRLEAIEHVEIRARVGGFITAVNVTPGALVHKGDTLFVIDPRPYQAELARAEAAAASARAKADLAKIELARAEKLLGEKAIAQRELDEASATMKELDANARGAQAQFATAQLNLAYTRVLAPIDGRVGKADITLGNLVDSSAILTSVVSNQRIYAGFDGDEDTYLRVGALAHQGKQVTVNVGLANETGFPHQGRLEFVDNQLDPATGSVRMRAVFDNADNTLVPGLFARVRLDGGNGGKKLTHALLINERAVGTDQNRKFVLVVTADGKSESRTVTLGANIDGMRIVQGGLKEGDKIVVDGLQRVHPGDPVSPRMVPMTFDPTAPAATAQASKTSVKEAS